ncbi:MAG: hypothetical protein LBE38_04245 [Deltaproteobacteria bacterium]|jgi:hypothetical protein|nr:hypothetical protein [Deltaproteobacteria bacterium]
MWVPLKNNLKSPSRSRLIAFVWLCASLAVTISLFSAIALKADSSSMAAGAKDLTSSLPLNSPMPHDSVPIPGSLKINLEADPVTKLEAFLAIPYRVDGTIDERANFTLWGDPQRVFQSPGLNCSGFLLSATRFLKGVNFTLLEAKRDILGDSGVASENGEDWDFGLDVVLNLAGADAKLYPDHGLQGRIVDDKGTVLGLGVNIHGPEFLELLASLQNDRLYLFAISKPDRRFKGGISYYHNGLILKGPDGETWLYHSTHRAGVNRVNLNAERGLSAFRISFPETARGERRILLVETGFDYHAKPVLRLGYTASIFGPVAF